MVKSINKIWDNIKQTNIAVIRVLKLEKKGIEKKHDKIMGKYLQF